MGFGRIRQRWAGRKRGKVMTDTSFETDLNSTNSGKIAGLKSPHVHSHPACVTCVAVYFLMPYEVL
jgi:hypothetical protein